MLSHFSRPPYQHRTIISTANTCKPGSNLIVESDGRISKCL